MLRLRGARSGVLMQQIGRLFLEGTSIGSSEGELLDRFVKGATRRLSRHWWRVMGRWSWVCAGSCFATRTTWTTPFRRRSSFWFARRRPCAGATFWATGFTALPTGWRCVREVRRHDEWVDSALQRRLRSWRPPKTYTDRIAPLPRHSWRWNASPGFIRKSATCRRSTGLRSYFAISRA